MKNTKAGRFVCIVLLCLQLAAEALSLAVIIRLNILPDQYFNILLGVYIFGMLLTSALVLIPAKKENRGKGRRIIACILAIIIIVLCAVSFKMLSDIYDTMSTITQKPTNSITRQVYVMWDDPALTLEDARDYSFGIVENYDTAYTQLAIAGIEDILDQQINISTFPSVTSMIDALTDGQCNAIILNSGYISLLDDMEAYKDFSDVTRILYHVPIDPSAIELPTTPTVPEDTEPIQTETTDPISAPSVSNTPFIMYISGSDTRSHYLNVSLSDVNILAVVNPNTHQVLLVNTPRDYYIPNPYGGGQLDKLTHCGVYGIDCSILALSNLYDISIDYYSQINFNGFKTLIDAIDGVNVYSSTTFTREGTTIYKGENHLYGEAALIFARERYKLAGGDSARGQNQMKVIKAVIQKLTTGTTIISNYAQILNSMEGMFVTSMEMNDISQLVKLQLKDMPSWNVQSFGVIGNQGSEITYSMPGQKLSVMYQSKAYISHAKVLIEKVLSGETLSEEDLKLPS